MITLTTNLMIPITGGEEEQEGPLFTAAMDMKMVLTFQKRICQIFTVPGSPVIDSEAVLR